MIGLRRSKPEHPGTLSLDPKLLGKDAREIARVWDDGEGGAVVSIAADVLEDPFEFGRLLADTARHGALAYAGTWSLDEAEALREIVNGLVEELREQEAIITKIQDGSLN